MRRWRKWRNVCGGGGHALQACDPRRGGAQLSRARRWRSKSAPDTNYLLEKAGQQPQRRWCTAGIGPTPNVLGAEMNTR